MEGILTGLVNLGMGGVMAAALIWFLHHLVTRTLPEMTRSFREDVAAERGQRLLEHQALLEMIERWGERQRREHEAALDRIDYGFKEVVNEITEIRTALERLLEGWAAPGQPAPPRKPRPHE